MLADVLAGMARPQKAIPSKYLYDEVGSRLFDEITELEEYYVTRTETALLSRYGSEMAELVGPNAVLVEPGAGSGAKTRVLLDALERPARYVPIDISADYLRHATRRLTEDYPSLPVTPVAADFTGPLHLPELKEGGRRRCVFFPGSTIGNFIRSEARALLARMRRLAGPSGCVIVGVDLAKPVDVLRAAYNDSQGVTADFNLNVLTRINEELDADFDLASFEHQAIFNELHTRIEMHLVSRRRQRVTISGKRFYFGVGESVLTEYSHKYTLERFADLAHLAGLSVRRTWTDPRGWFSVQFLVPA